MATNINVFIKDGLLAGNIELLASDAYLRSASRNALSTRSRDSKVEKQAATKVSEGFQFSRSSGGLQDPPTYKRRRLGVLAIGSGATNDQEDQNDGGSGSGPEFPVVMKAVDTNYSVNDQGTNFDYQGWFGIAFTVAETSPLRLEYVGCWDREGNGIGASVLFALWGQSGLIWNATISSGSFVHSKDNFRYAQIPPITLEAGGEYGLFRYYYANVLTDRYQYSFNGSNASFSSSLSSCGQTENSAQSPFPPTNAGIGIGGSIQAMNVNFATTGYFQPPQEP